MVQNTEKSWIIADFCGEAFGTTTFILFILIQTSPETTFTPNGNALTNYGLVSLALYFSRAYTSHSGGCINPGMAFSLELVQSYKDHDPARLQYLWIFLFAPFCGSVAAASLYQIYKRLVPLNKSK